MPDKIKISKEEFNDMYEVIEPDTPQPDLDHVKEKEPYMTIDEQIEDADDKLAKEFFDE